MSENPKKEFEELSVSQGSSKRWKYVQLFILSLGFVFLFLALFFGFKLGYSGLLMLLFVFATVFKGYHKPDRKRMRKRRF